MTMRMALNYALVAAVAVLAGCAASRPAPVDDRRPPAGTVAKPLAPLAAPVTPAPPPPGLGQYTVRRGDTLYSIALEHGVDFRDLAKWNGLDDPARIRVGQVLRTTSPEAPQGAVVVGTTRVPGAGAGGIESRPLDAGATPAAPPAVAEGATRTSPKALRLPYSEQNLALLQRGESAPATAAPAKPAPPPVAAAPAPKPEPASPAPDGLALVWPAKGAVLAGFSEPRLKGIDIAGRVGDPVVAAAAGKVIYVGSGIPGLGKFVVIKHNEEFSTVYAHAKEILVKMDQSVARGQRIAELGDSDADRPKLHFQVRKLGKPLDPAGFLPPA